MEPPTKTGPVEDVPLFLSHLFLMLGFDNLQNDPYTLTCSRIEGWVGRREACLPIRWRLL